MLVAKRDYYAHFTTKLFLQLENSAYRASQCCSVGTLRSNRSSYTKMGKTMQVFEPMYSGVVSRLCNSANEDSQVYLPIDA